MKTSEAVAHVLEHDKNANQNKLAKAIGCTHTSIKNYLDGKTTMNKRVYERFKKIYPTIKIDDVRNSSQGGSKVGNGELGVLTYE